MHEKLERLGLPDREQIKSFFNKIAAF
jgi:hypothetical protein